MPLLPTAIAGPPPWLWNGHLQTIVPSLWRRVAGVRYARERLELPDGDFLDLDWSPALAPAVAPADGNGGGKGGDRGAEHDPAHAPARALVIVSHGLEGDSGRPYVRGMVRACNQAGFDALAWNYRSCGSPEPNRLLRSYHLGDTADLHTVLTHALGRGAYQRVGLAGFSAGGNITLKYLGEDAARVPAAVRGAVAFSTPIDLAACARHLARWQNRVYMRRFLRSLHGKLEAKQRVQPGHIDLKGYDRITSFELFDDRYTAPLHGFASAAAYYRASSARQHLAGLRVPTLLVQAANDPFLPPACYPWAEADALPGFSLEIPPHGGHCGFAEHTAAPHNYAERRAVAFLRETGL